MPRVIPAVAIITAAVWRVCAWTGMVEECRYQDFPVPPGMSMAVVRRPSSSMNAHITKLAIGCNSLRRSADC
jgi:hypothetical protein